MPELPEVEVVRRGLEKWLVGRGVTTVSVLHPRAVRKHLAGAQDFERGVAGVTVLAACRRGKYLWLRLDSDAALVAHLGMSGQLLFRSPAAPAERHLRVRLSLTSAEHELRFVDQRTFGHLRLDGLADQPAPSGVDEVPQSITHIARDPLDSEFDAAAFGTALRARRSAVKRALLDQALISGVGNIYADEALWHAGLHGQRPSWTLSETDVTTLVKALRNVMTAALDAGGTSFDSLYVDVNGASGYFSRDLHVYGQEGQPCARCATPVRRAAFMNRSSFWCPQCQPVW